MPPLYLLFWEKKSDVGGDQGSPVAALQVELVEKQSILHELLEDFGALGGVEAFLGGGGGEAVARNGWRDDLEHEVPVVGWCRQQRKNLVELVEGACERDKSFCLIIFCVTLMSQG